VFTAFRKYYPKYRDGSGAAALPDPVLRDMVRSWTGSVRVERTSGGFYKNVSLRPR